MSAHIPQTCDIAGCEQEATYWIDTSEGFAENMLGNGSKDTFYLCLDHQYELNGKEEHEGFYVHLRTDTGEIWQREIGKYSCSDNCDECNR
jgi:hypothetical protein